MSEENVEIVRRVWQAWEEDPVTFPVSLISAEAVYEDDILPDHVGETYHGREGFLKAWAAWTEPWETFEVELAWTRDAGDAVVSCHRVQARGKQSGVEFDGSYCYLWKFRDGKVSYCRAYADPAQALE